MSTTVSLDITGMSCGHCVATVERALSTVRGIAHVEVRVGHADFAASAGGGEEAMTTAAVDAIREAGYEAVRRETQGPPRARTARACCCA